MKRDPDLTPLPKWKQKRAALVAWWRRTRNPRQTAYTSFKSGVQKVLTLAISVVGAMLVSYGVWKYTPGLGYVTAGFMCWLLLWSHERDKGGRG